MNNLLYIVVVCDFGYAAGKVALDTNVGAKYDPSIEEHIY